MTKNLVLALSGGVGGAKLALGLSHIVAPENLLIVANTGDDFEHLGLSISPDIDTLTYALANLDNQTLGWGRRDETWSFMETLATLGGPAWFRLGDRDLALHVQRTLRLKAGETLAAITADLTARLGIAARILPMSNDPVRTRVDTNEGILDFQDYFVGRQCQPEVKSLHFAGAEAARPHPDFRAALASPSLRAVIICPSNPFISVEPILALPGIRTALAACEAPVIAVSPIIGGRAVKGPTAKMMTELGLTPSAAAVAARYADFLDGYIIDHQDAAEAAGLTPRTILAATLMTTLEHKIALAQTALDLADSL
ncbi:MAG: 2-phospho-L-lactate transferase [Acetobacteraceae bacterium]|nr:2-phospho-L-lactate transferase [Acetobacteraceae bacterium]